MTSTEHPNRLVRRFDRAGRSLGAIANISLATALITGILGTIVVWVTFNSVLESRERLFDRVGPAQVQTQQLRTALLDQETGVRGFALTGEVRFLEPYQSGQADEQRAERDLHESIGQYNAEAQRSIDTITAGAEQWRRTIADPIIASPKQSDAAQVFSQSKQVFDVLRGEIDELDRQVEHERQMARDELNAATWRLGIAIALAIVGLTAAGCFGAWLLRRRVVAPLEQLVAETDTVSAGQFDTPIRATGPTEIERLTTQVDRMRLRILEELATVETSKQQLAEQAQDLERSNRDLEQFAYVASHDLQEPLRKVASFCQLLEQRYADQLDEKGRLYIEYAVDGAKRMQALISDLLDFSRVGRQVERFVSVDLAELTDSIIESYADTIGETGASITRGALPVVSGDPSLLGALIQNLIGNALKYRSSDAALQVRIDAERSGDDWSLSCVDNGIGIDEQFRERVFVIFQRLHSRDEFAGTGIGLALCKKIVEYHGGRIWIDEPADGVGTTVRFTLPVPQSTLDHPDLPTQIGARS